MGSSLKQHHSVSKPQLASPRNYNIFTFPNAGTTEISTDFLMLKNTDDDKPQWKLLQCWRCAKPWGCNHGTPTRRKAGPMVELCVLHASIQCHRNKALTLNVVHGEDSRMVESRLANALIGSQDEPQAFDRHTLWKRAHRDTESQSNPQRED